MDKDQQFENETECEHDWVRCEGTGLTRGVPFRFCSHCDREEWDNGVVR